MEKIKLVFAPDDAKTSETHAMFGIPDDRGAVLCDTIARIAAKARASLDESGKLKYQPVVQDICGLAENPQEAAYCGFVACMVIEKIKHDANDLLRQLFARLSEEFKKDEPAPSQPTAEHNG